MVFLNNKAFVINPAQIRKVLKTKRDNYKNIRLFSSYHVIIKSSDVFFIAVAVLSILKLIHS